MSQTSITQDPPVARAGMLADNGPRRIESFISSKEGPDAGPAVLAGTNNEPFDLTDGDVLTLYVNGVAYNITFTQGAGVADINAVTFAEVKALIEAVAPVTFADVGTSSTITTDDTGSDVTLQAAAGPVQQALGLPLTVARGTDGSVVPLDAGLGVTTEITKDDVDEVRSPKWPTVTGTQVFRGVAMYDASEQAALPEVAGTVGDYPPGKMVPVITKGVVWVHCETAVNETDPVYMRIVATGNEVAGHFRNSADGTDTMQITNARWRSRLSSAGLAKLEIW